MPGSTAGLGKILLAIQQETQDFKTFGKIANSDQVLIMTRYALDMP